MWSSIMIEQGVTYVRKWPITKKLMKYLKKPHTKFIFFSVFLRKQHHWQLYVLSSTDFTIYILDSLLTVSNEFVDAILLIVLYLPNFILDCALEDLWSILCLQSSLFNKDASKYMSEPIDESS